MNRVACLAVSSAVVALFAGCAKAPDQELAAAKAALVQAQQTEANLYAADQFKQAEEAINTATAEIQKQDSAFALGRDYTEAKKSLASAEALAKAAAEAAAGAKQQAQAVAETAITEAKAAAENASALIAKAPKGKKGAAAVEMMKTELEAVTAGVADAEGTLAAGNLLGASEKANAAKVAAQKICDEINVALEKAGKR